YGIDILKVQEIRGYETPTRIAQAPAFIKGVTNLRGTIVPIVDMRLRFACARADYDTFTVVIILNLRERVVGIVVDSVSDVMELAAENIRPAPDVDSAIDAACIRGLGSVGERMLILLDIEKLMSGVDMGLATAD
uniref:chemotaxis protein CheW n=1 Tax=Pulveribacter sp. TaxID=2678893 RepID=UPI0028ADC782